MSAFRELASRLSASRSSQAFAKWLTKVDVALQRRTNARFSLMRLAGVDGLLLTTTGRRSGAPRSVVVQYQSVDDGYLVAGSNWGEATHPAWSSNLLAKPEAQVAIGGRVVPVVGRLVAGEERDRLWDLLVGRWPAFEGYAQRSGREIRLFLLTPTS
jgi:deazaflavin-dependent oxidoreductase (nitroreductase family)